MTVADFLFYGYLWILRWHERALNIGMLAKQQLYLRKGNASPADRAFKVKRAGKPIRYSLATPAMELCMVNVLKEFPSCIPTVILMRLYLAVVEELQ
jgi:hypothetical protein